ncbi:MAG: response regulator transcription factor [Lachnospiraceae bacterium]
MNTVLVVEDEKMIREGIVVMIKRMKLPIEEILQAKNGFEALELLKIRKIDILITDIRMPKMDGIELVGALKQIKQCPHTIVVSGYDDFNYAVEVLRQGVRDYLLKPIEREKLEVVLRNICNDIEEEKGENYLEKQIGYQQIKYLLLNDTISESEVEIIRKQLDDIFPTDEYLVCCFNKKEKNNTLKKGIYIEDVGDYSVSIISKEMVEEIENISKEFSIGMSDIHNGIASLKNAYLEAQIARKEAFIRSCPYCYYKERTSKYEPISKEFVEHFVQVYGTDKMEGELKKYHNMLLKAKMNKIAAEDFYCMTEQLIKGLYETYCRIIDCDIEAFQEIQIPLSYNTGQEYFKRFDLWIRSTQEKIVCEFEDYKNKDKINKAILFIHDNFKTDLNMAVVSNYVSMNYSLFSLCFKQYTGTNFVNYLKQIRMDEAKKLLETTEEKIIDISNLVGYENEKHFMKIFKRECGVSPSEYRKNYLFSKK